MRSLLQPMALAAFCAAFASSFVDVLPPSMRPRPATAPSRSLALRSSADAIMNVPEPLPSSPAYSLYHLILQNRACRKHGGSGSHCKSIPIAGVHDALSAKIFAQNGAPALFVSGFGVSASLLGLPDAGMTNLVEMEMMARNIVQVVRSPGCRSISVDGSSHPPPIICDGDTGYGGAPNMLRTMSALANAGVAAVSIEDQKFPKKCTIAAGSKIQIVDREEAIQRVRGALGARDVYIERSHSSNVESGRAGPWIVARTDCRMAYGFQEVVERCLRFEELGAEIIYAENLQSREEYAELRDRLDSRTVIMVAQVQENNRENQRDANSKPLLTIHEIGELGYDLSLFGVTPLQVAVGALESAAKDFLGNSEDEGTGIISSSENMADFSSVKRVVGFDELQVFETEFPCA